MVSILRPCAVRPGDVVAVAALSGGLQESEAAQFARGVEVIERMGFTVRVSPLVHLNRQWRWAAAPPREIAGEFNSLLRDPEVRAIFGLTGGRVVLGYLDLIDFAAIRADPKPVLGFSDISALHLALYARTGLVGFHCDLVTHGFGNHAEIGEDDRARLAEIYCRVLTSDRPAGPLPLRGDWACWRPGRARGRLIGGMLNRLVRVQATPYAVSGERFDGAVLFLEEAFTPVSAVWNDLQVLRSAGVFDRIAGLVVGPSDCLDASEAGFGSLREIVLDVLGGRDIPVLGNVDIGHNPPNVPLPLGLAAELDSAAGLLSLVEPAVRGSGAT